MYWRFGIVGIDNDQRPRKKLRGMTLLLPHELPAQEQEWNEISLAEILLNGGTEGDLHYRPRPQDFLVGDGSFEEVPDSALHSTTVPFSRLDGPERLTSTKDRAETEWKRRKQPWYFCTKRPTPPWLRSQHERNKTPDPRRKMCMCLYECHLRKDKEERPLILCEVQPSSTPLVLGSGETTRALPVSGTEQEQGQ